MIKDGAQVYRYMTPCPQTIQRDATLADAREAMSRYGIRHLPVLDGHDLVGILSDRDLAVAEKLSDVFRVAVAEIMSLDPYVAFPEAALVEVTAQMASHRYGAVVVVDRGNVVGVFTTTDALRAIGEERLPGDSQVERVPDPAPARSIG
jgi:acetoin utilization protein AcuB